MTEEIPEENQEIQEELQEELQNNLQAENLEDLGDQTDEAEEADEEIELNGSLVKVPKALSETITQHKQQIEAKAAEIDQRKQAFELQTQVHEQLMTDITTIKSIDAQLAEYAQLDWGTLAEQDNLLFMKLQAQQKQIEYKRGQLVNEFAAKRDKAINDIQLSKQKELESSEATLRKEIAGWNKELESKMQQFAVKELGFSMTDVVNAKADPRTYKLLHKAYVGDQLIKSQTKKKETIKPAPVTNIKSRSAVAGKNPANMTPQEYMKWRSVAHK